MSDEVLVSVPCFPDDELGVEHDEATEDRHSNPEVSLQQSCQPHKYFLKADTDLEEHGGPEEDVEESQPEESGESRQESSAKIQILTIRSRKSSSSEAGEHDAGDHEGGGDDAGVHHHGQLQHGSHAQASQEPESQEHGESLTSVLTIVRSQEQSKCEASSQEREDDASALENVGEDMNIGSQSGGQHCHGERGVDILQVRSHMGLAETNYELFIQQY